MAKKALASQLVRVLAFDSTNSNVLPLDHTGGFATYVGGDTIIGDGNLADVYSSRAIDAKLSERDALIRKLQTRLDKLGARASAKAARSGKSGKRAGRA